MIWNFRDISETQFPEGLPIHMTLGVFRTHKGNIERPILGSITLRNPWGVDGGGNNDGSDDGYVTFTASQFTGYFNGATASYM